MVRFLAALMLCVSPMISFAGEWLSDYAEAYKQAQSADKPIFVFFTDSVAQPNWKERFAGLESLTDKFVTLVVDKAQPKNADVFKLFEIEGSTGTVVVERNRQWQFYRTSRDLDNASLSKVLAECKEAKGKPANSVLTAASTQSTDAIPASVSMQTPSSNYCPRCQRLR